MSENKEKKERVVIHLHLLNSDEHHYFGSVANLYEYYDAKQIGITYGALRNYGLTSEHPYKNNYCIIRKGVLRTKSGNRGAAIIKLHQQNKEKK